MNWWFLLLTESLLFQLRWEALICFFSSRLLMGFNFGLLGGRFKNCLFQPDDWTRFSRSINPNSIPFAVKPGASAVIPLKLDASKSSPISRLFWQHCRVMQMLLERFPSFESCQRKVQWEEEEDLPGLIAPFKTWIEYSSQAAHIHMRRLCKCLQVQRCSDKANPRLPLDERLH